MYGLLDVFIRSSFFTGPVPQSTFILVFMLDTINVLLCNTCVVLYVRGSCWIVITSYLFLVCDRIDTISWFCASNREFTVGVPSFSVLGPSFFLFQVLRDDSKVVQSSFVVIHDLTGHRNVVCYLFCLSNLFGCMNINSNTQ